MRQARVLEAFSGGPDGRRPFAAGDVVDLSEADAALYAKKGHVEIIAEPEPTKPATSARRKKE